MATQRTAGTLPRRKTKRAARIPLLLVGLGLLGAAGWWGWTKVQPQEDPLTKILTDTVKRGDLVENVAATGSITAQTGAQVKIGSQITGRIKRLYADVGSSVKSGDIIAELDLPDIEAQLRQAEASRSAAETRLRQQRSGFGMVRAQTSGNVAQAVAALNSAKARLRVAQAAEKQQTAQTQSEIKRAESQLKSAQAALTTANSQYQETKAGVELQIASATENVNQAKSTAKNNALNLRRQKELLAKGFVAESVVDTAQSAYDISQSQIVSTTKNLELVKNKSAADLQAAKDRVTQAQEVVEGAKANVDAAKAMLYQDKSRLAEIENAKAQVRQAETALRTAKANTTQDVLKQDDIQQAKEALAQAKAQVDYAIAQRDKTYIRSPISGTVLQLASQQGETLAAGLSAPTLIIVADLKRLEVLVYVDETDIGKIRKAQTAEVRVDAFPKKVFKGKVTKVASGSTIQQGVVTYGVIVSLESVENENTEARGASVQQVEDGKQRQADPKREAAPGSRTVSGEDPMSLLKPDMTASVTILTGVRKNVLLVPAEAVKVGSRGININVVTTKDGKKSVEQRRIKTGGTDGTATEIREGVNEGDTVVLAGLESEKKGPSSSSPFGPQNSGRSGGGGGGGGRRGGM